MTIRRSVLFGLVPLLSVVQGAAVAIPKNGKQVKRHGFNLGDALSLGIDTAGQEVADEIAVLNSEGNIFVEVNGDLEGEGARADNAIETDYVTVTTGAEPTEIPAPVVDGAAAIETPGPGLRLVTPINEEVNTPVVIKTGIGIVMISLPGIETISATTRSLKTTPSVGTDTAAAPAPTVTEVVPALEEPISTNSTTIVSSIEVSIDLSSIAPVATNETLIPSASSVAAEPSVEGTPSDEVTLPTEAVSSTGPTAPVESVEPEATAPVESDDPETEADPEPSATVPLALESEAPVASDPATTIPAGQSVNLGGLGPAATPPAAVEVAAPEVTDPAPVAAAAQVDLTGLELNSVWTLGNLGRRDVRIKSRETAVGSRH